MAHECLNKVVAPTDDVYSYVNVVLCLRFFMQTHRKYETMTTNSAMMMALLPTFSILPSTMANRHEIVSPNQMALLFPMQQMQFDEVEEVVVG
jgi:hypothetical protein